MSDKKLIAHLNRVSGQVEAIKSKLASDNYDCEQIIMQTKAVVGSMQQFAKAFAKSDLDKCYQSGMSEQEMRARFEKLVDISI